MAPERPITASPRPLRFVTLLASALFVAGLVMPGPAHALKVTYTFCLGGLSFFLFLMLTLTGILLMF